MKQFVGAVPQGDPFVDWSAPPSPFINAVCCCAVSPLLDVPEIVHPGALYGSQ
jgi:hypothetical protein